MLSLLAENSIIHLFARKLIDAKYCDMLVMLNSDASGQKYRVLLTSLAKRKETSLQITSKISLRYNRKGIGPRMLPWISKLGSYVKQFTIKTRLSDNKCDENHDNIVSTKP